jgi:small subunit ribosomal protein S6
MKTPYETMFLLPPTVTGEQVDELLDRLKKSVEKKSGEIMNIDKMGVRKTAYTVNKHRSAFYVLVQYRGTGETLVELERTLKNTDEVLKFLSTKVTTRVNVRLKPAAPAAAPAEVAAAPAAEVPAPSAEVSAPSAEVPAASASPAPHTEVPQE